VKWGIKNEIELNLGCHSFTYISLLNVSILSRNPTNDEKRSRDLIDALTISNINVKETTSQGEFIISSWDVKE